MASLFYLHLTQAALSYLETLVAAEGGIQESEQGQGRSSPLLHGLVRPAGAAQQGPWGIEACHLHLVKLYFSGFSQVNLEPWQVFKGTWPLRSSSAPGQVLGQHLLNKFLNKNYCQCQSSLHHICDRRIQMAKISSHQALPVHLGKNQAVPGNTHSQKCRSAEVGLEVRWTLRDRGWPVCHSLGFAKFPDPLRGEGQLIKWQPGSRASTRILVFDKSVFSEACFLTGKRRATGSMTQDSILFSSQMML